MMKRSRSLPSQRLASLGSLIGSVAHEVRNPLFILMATLDAWEAVEGKDPKLQKYMTPLREQVNRLNLLMQEVMEYGRPAPEILTEGPLDRVISEAIELCKHLASRRDVKLRTVVDSDPACLPMNRERLQQAFRNVLENALQYAPAGSAVRIATEKVARDGNDWIQCTITDSGPGFRPDELKKVFEPFYSRRQGGTGMGLALVQRIVEEHGGSVRVYNAPKGGAVVEISLLDKSQFSRPSKLRKNKNPSRSPR